MIANIGLSFQDTILLIVAVGGIILYAKDFKIGVILHLIAFSLLFIWFYIQGWDWSRPLMAALVMIVLLALSIYMVDKTSPYNMV